MSNLPTTSITHTFNGDAAARNAINAAQVDTQLGNLAANQNAQKAVIDRLTDSENGLAAAIVGYEQLAPELQLALASASGWQPKISAACATTANITLSGEQTIDGVLTAASVVLVKNQTNPAQNGLYTSGGGAWTRTADSDTGAELVYAVVSVLAGTANFGSIWVTTNSTAPTVGITAISWVPAPIRRPTIEAAYSYDPPNLVNGAGIIVNIPVYGALPGDFVLVSFSLNLLGIILSAYVVANDSIGVVFQNNTGGAINLGAGVIKIRVEK